MFQRSAKCFFAPLMRDSIRRREIEAAPKFPNEKIIFDLNEWNFVKIDQVETDANAQEGLTEIYRDLLTDRIAILEPQIRPTAFGAVRCENDGVHGKGGIRLVQFASKAFCLQEERIVEGHSEPQPTGTMVAKCVFWDHIIGPGWDRFFQPPRNFCEENKKLFRLDDVLATGLDLEKTSPEGHDGKDTPPDSLLYDFNRNAERRLRCRFLGLETWNQLIAERHIRSSMEEVAIEFFETYNLKEDTPPPPQIDDTERRRKMNEEAEKKKQELLKTYLFKPTAPLPVESVAPTPPAAAAAPVAAAAAVTAPVRAPRKRKTTKQAITFSEKPKHKRKTSQNRRKK